MRFINELEENIIMYDNLLGELSSKLPDKLFNELSKKLTEEAVIELNTDLYLSLEDMLYT